MLVDYDKLLLHEQNVPCSALIEQQHARIDKRSRTRVCAVCSLRAMKAYGRVEVLDLILTTAIYLGELPGSLPDRFTFGVKNIWCLLSGGLMWAPESAWAFWGAEKLFARTGIQTPYHSTYSLVTILPTPFRLFECDATRMRTCNFCYGVFHLRHKMIAL
jgi:hypothetical protein